jgi:hypothetical protein
MLQLTNTQTSIGARALYWAIGFNLNGVQHFFCSHYLASWYMLSAYTDAVRGSKLRKRYIWRTQKCSDDLLPCTWWAGVLKYKVSLHLPCKEHDPIRLLFVILVIVWQHNQWDQQICKIIFVGFLSLMDKIQYIHFAIEMCPIHRQDTQTIVKK